MDWAAKSDLFTLLLRLTPGFLAAWIFFGLTAHEKRDAFERVVQALIFTGVVHASLACIARLCIFWGTHFFSIGVWNDQSNLVGSILLGFTVGVSFAILANKDIPHRWLRSRGLTTRTTYPSEWCAAFQAERRMIVLQRLDGRRIYGEPIEWPDRSDSGHFVLAKPAWVDCKTGTRTPLIAAEKMLIKAADVDWVEIESLPEEHGLSELEMMDRVKPITALYKE